MARVVGLYPGTFDPPTNGHFDIIMRGARVVEELIVGVALNAGKGPLFGVEDRVAMVEEWIANLEDRDIASRITVRTMDGLLVHYAKGVGANVIMRGLRAVSDFDYEFQMTGMNSRLDNTIETVFLMASERCQYISSRFVKEIAALDGDISSFVPTHVKNALDLRLNNGGTVQAGAASKVY